MVAIGQYSCRLLVGTYPLAQRRTLRVALSDQDNQASIQTPPDFQDTMQQKDRNDESIPMKENAAARNDNKDWYTTKDICLGCEKSSEPPRSIGEILSDEQSNVWSRVKAGENVFFTGSAGTGKSSLLRKIISWCREQHSAERVAVTAPTGIAAVHIGGTTLHSWAGIGLGKGSAQTLLARIRSQHKRHEDATRGVGSCDTRTCSWSDGKGRTCLEKCWRNCRVLIIDESKSFPVF